MPLSPAKLAALLTKAAKDLRIVAAVLVAVAAVVLQLAGVFSPSSPPGTSCTAGPAHMGQCAPKPTGTQQASLLALPASARTIGGLVGGDFSSNNGPINLGGYRGAFAFIKATEGRSYVNPLFAAQWAALKARGVPHGAYDFTRPDQTSGSGEAHHFCSVVNAHGGFGSLPPVLDVEYGPATRAWVGDAARTLRACSHRQTIIIYTGAWFWNPHIGCVTFGARLWVSGYASAPPMPCGWKAYTLWQFTNGTNGPLPHTVPGIGVRADVSVFNGTRAQLDQLATNHRSKPQPKPSPKPQPKPRPVPHHGGKPPRHHTTARQRHLWERHHRLAHLKLHQHCSPPRPNLVGYCAGERARNRKLHHLLGI